MEIEVFVNVLKDVENFWKETKKKFNLDENWKISLINVKNNDKVTI